MKVPEQVFAILVSENGTPYVTSVEDILYVYRKSLMRDALERYGVPYGRQPASARECVRLLAKRMGLVGASGA